MRQSRDKTRGCPRGRRKLEFGLPKQPLPLLNKAVYVDVKNGKQADLLEEYLKLLGARVEKFLSGEVNYVISSSGPSKADERAVCREENPQSPSFVPSPFNCGPSPTEQSESKSAVVSRGKALAQIACAKNKASSVVTSAEKLGIKVVSLDVASKWLEREIKKIKLVKGSHVKENKAKKTEPKQKENRSKPKLLKGSFIKFEDKSRHYRPVRIELDKWPRLNLSAPPGIFPFGEAKVKVQHQYGARNQPPHGKEPGFKVVPPQDDPAASKFVDDGVRADQATLVPEVVGVPIDTTGDAKRIFNFQFKKNMAINKQQGYCDCCCVKFQNMDQHINGEQHRSFARHKSNFEKLDSLISQLPSTASFLQSVLLKHCLQKQTEPLINSGTTAENLNFLHPLSSLTTGKTNLPSPEAADTCLKTPENNQLDNSSYKGQISGDEPAVMPRAETTPVKGEDNRPQAVIIRRPLPSGMFTSPRRRQPTPSKPWIQERSMVFKDSPIASLQPSPCDSGHSFVNFLSDSTMFVKHNQIKMSGNCMQKLEDACVQKSLANCNLLPEKPVDFSSLLKQKLSNISSLIHAENTEGDGYSRNRCLKNLKELSCCTRKTTLKTQSCTDQKYQLKNEDEFLRKQTVEVEMEGVHVSGDSEGMRQNTTADKVLTHVDCLKTTYQVGDMRCQKFSFISSGGDADGLLCGEGEGRNKVLQNVAENTPQKGSNKTLDKRCELPLKVTAETPKKREKNYPEEIFELSEKSATKTPKKGKNKSVEEKCVSFKKTQKDSLQVVDNELLFNAAVETPQIEKRSLEEKCVSPQKMSAGTPQKEKRRSVKEINESPQKNSTETPKKLKRRSVKEIYESPQKISTETPQKEKRRSVKEIYESPQKNSTETPKKLKRRSVKEIHESPQKISTETPQKEKRRSVKEIYESPQKNSTETPKKLKRRSVKEIYESPQKISTETPQKVKRRSLKEKYESPQKISAQTPQKEKRKSLEEKCKTPQQTSLKTLQEPTVNTSLKDYIQSSHKDFVKLNKIKRKKLSKVSRKTPQKKTNNFEIRDEAATVDKNKVEVFVLENINRSENCADNFNIPHITTKAQKDKIVEAELKLKSNTNPPSNEKLKLSIISKINSLEKHERENLSTGEICIPLKTVAKSRRIDKINMSEEIKTKSQKEEIKRLERDKICSPSPKKRGTKSNHRNTTCTSKTVGAMSPHNYNTYLSQKEDIISLHIDKAHSPCKASANIHTKEKISTSKKTKEACDDCIVSEKDSKQQRNRSYNQQKIHLEPECSKHANCSDLVNRIRLPKDINLIQRCAREFEDPFLKKEELKAEDYLNKHCSNQDFNNRDPLTEYWPMRRNKFSEHLTVNEPVLCVPCETDRKKITTASSQEEKIVSKCLLEEPNIQQSDSDKIIAAMPTSTLMLKDCSMHLVHLQSSPNDNYGRDDDKKALKDKTNSVEKKILFNKFCVEPIHDPLIELDEHFVKELHYNDTDSRLKEDMIAVTSHGSSIKNMQKNFWPDGKLNMPDTVENKEKSSYNLKDVSKSSSGENNCLSTNVLLEEYASGNNGSKKCVREEGAHQLVEVVENDSHNLVGTVKNNNDSLLDTVEENTNNFVGTMEGSSQNCNDLGIKTEDGIHYLVEKLDGFHHFEQKLEDSSHKMVGTMENITFRSLETLGSSNDHLMGRIDNRTCPLFATSENKTNHLVRTLIDNSHPLVKTLDDISQHLGETLDNITQHLVVTIDVNNHHLIETLDDSIHHLLETLEDSSPHLVGSVEGSNQHLVGTVGDSTPHLEGTMDKGTPHFEGTIQDDINQIKASVPESTHVLMKSVDNSHHLLNALDNSTHHGTRAFNDKSHLVDEEDSILPHLLETVIDITHPLRQNLKESTSYLQETVQDTTNPLLDTVLAQESDYYLNFVRNIRVNVSEDGNWLMGEDCSTDSEADAGSCWHESGAVNSLVVPNIADRVKRRSRATCLTLHSSCDKAADDNDVAKKERRRRKRARKGNTSSQIGPESAKYDMKPNDGPFHISTKNVSPSSIRPVSTSLKGVVAGKEVACMQIVPNIAESVKIRRSCTLFNHEGQYANNGEGYDGEAHDIKGEPRSAKKNKLGHYSDFDSKVSFQTQENYNALTEYENSIHDKLLSMGKKINGCVSMNQESEVNGNILNQTCKTENEICDVRSAVVIRRKKSGTYPSNKRPEVDWARTQVSDCSDDNCDNNIIKKELLTVNHRIEADHSHENLKSTPDRKSNPNNDESERVIHDKVFSFSDSYKIAKHLYSAEETQADHNDKYQRTSGTAKSWQASCHHGLKYCSPLPSSPSGISCSPRLRLKIKKHPDNQGFSSTLEEIHDCIADIPSDSCELRDKVNKAKQHTSNPSHEFSSESSVEQRITAIVADSLLGCTPSYSEDPMQSSPKVIRSNKRKRQTIDNPQTVYCSQPIESPAQPPKRFKKSEKADSVSNNTNKLDKISSGHKILTPQKSCSAGVHILPQDKVNRLPSHLDSRSKSPCFSSPYRGLKFVRTPPKTPPNNPNYKCQSPVFNKSNTKHCHLKASSSRSDLKLSKSLKLLKENKLSPLTLKHAGLEADVRVECTTKSIITASKKATDSKKKRLSSQADMNFPSAKRKKVANTHEKASEWCSDVKPNPTLVHEPFIHDAPLHHVGFSSSSHMKFTYTDLDNYVEKNVVVGPIKTELMITESGAIMPDMCTKEEPDWGSSSTIIYGTETEVDGMLLQVPTFSSPGKITDSSWGDICDSYISSSVSKYSYQDLEHPGHTTSPTRKTAKICPESPFRMFMPNIRSPSKWTPRKDSSQSPNLSSPSRRTTSKETFQRSNWSSPSWSTPSRSTPRKDSSQRSNFGSPSRRTQSKETSQRPSLSSPSRRTSRKDSPQRPTLSSSSRRTPRKDSSQRPNLSSPSWGTPKKDSSHRPNLSSPSQRTQRKDSSQRPNFSSPSRKTTKKDSSHRPNFSSPSQRTQRKDSSQKPNLSSPSRRTPNLISPSRNIPVAKSVTAKNNMDLEKVRKQNKRSEDSVVSQAKRATAPSGTKDNHTQNFEVLQQELRTPVKSSKNTSPDLCPTVQQVDDVISFNYMSPQRLNFSPQRRDYSPMPHLSPSKLDKTFPQKRCLFSPTKNSRNVVCASSRNRP